MIIGLSGYARSGKDEIANILMQKYRFKRVAFADPIKEFVFRVNPILNDGRRLQSVVDSFGWEVTKSRSEARRMLQEVGVVARDMFGPNFWVDIALHRFNHHHDDVVISDVRFKNEFNTIKQLGGKVYRVSREHAVPVNNHISETELDNAVFDAMIENNGTLQDLEATVDDLMSSYAHKII